MLTATRMIIEIPILIAGEINEEKLRERFAGRDARMILDEVERAGCAVGMTTITSIENVSDEEVAVGLTLAGADIAPFVKEEGTETVQEARRHTLDLDTVVVIRPTVMHSASPDPVEGAVQILSRRHHQGGWTASWRAQGGEMHEIPHPHPTEEDASTDARRRYEASLDPETEADEFEDTVGQDPFDADIRYAALFIDDENRWKGRWYRSEWSSEGAYTELLYDTPGQARRAARRLHGTGDET